MARNTPAQQDQAEATSAQTPENTPIPGGGSWRWSATPPHWVPNTPEQAQQPTDAAQE